VAVGDNGRVNISPHHQKPTKYPWPGLASRLFVVVGLVVIVLIAWMLIADPGPGDPDDGASAGARVTLTA
jgi:hypothetical protein